MRGASALPAGVELKPLRWPGSAHEGESLIGLITRRGSEHFLGSNRLILRACGIDVHHQGSALSRATASNIKELARILRIEIEKLEQMACPVIGSDHSGDIVVWGERTMRLRDIETRYRRISPTSLDQIEHHRQSWLLRLLPYCPESFEQLIHTCPSCNSSLHWSLAKPISWCDQTGCENGARPIPPSTEFLREDMRREYTLFADLVSADANTAGAARASLHHDLQNIDNPTLVDLIFFMSDIDRPQGCKANMSISRSTNAADLAERIIKGTEAVSRWPEPLEEITRRALYNKKSEYYLWSRLKQVVSHHPNQELKTVLVQGVTALGDCRRTAAPPNSSPIMLQTELVQRTWISAEQGAFLSKGDYLRRNGREGDAGLSKFDRELGEEFIEQWKASTRNATVANRIKLPIYAIAQLGKAGSLQPTTNRGLNALEPEGCTMTASLDTLIDKLNALPFAAADTKELISIAAASKVIGGGLKPWATIIQLIIDGTLKCYRAESDKNPTARTLVIQRKDLPVLASLPIANYDDGVMCSSASKEDVTRILNATSRQIDDLEAEELLRFERKGKKLACQMSEVLALANERAFGAEMTMRTGIVPQKLEEWLSVKGIDKLPGGGWSRAAINKSLNI